MEDDLMDIRIDGKTVTEVAREIDTEVARQRAKEGLRDIQTDGERYAEVARAERKDARKLRREKARGWDDMLLQRDSAISRANGMTRGSNDLIWAMEGYFNAIDASLRGEEVDAEAVATWRRHCGNAMDDLDYILGGV
tara:strand:+ start:473 stop:886 length:414 start_codon:yes stop_codon:yes gene_type:complete